MAKSFTISTPVASGKVFKAVATMLKSGRQHVAYGETANAANNAAVGMAQDDCYGITAGAPAREYKAKIEAAAKRRA